MNIIQQISTFVENRPGAFREILQVIQSNGINIKALSIADTADFGILRFIVKKTPVLALTIGDKPGTLLTYVDKLSDAGINIEYVYAFTTAIENVAKVVVKADDVEQAMNLLSNDPEIKEYLQANDAVDFYW